MNERSLIAGRPSTREGRVFASLDPATGAPRGGPRYEPRYEAATSQDVDEACAVAWEAFRARPPAPSRADLLERSADAIDRLGSTLIDAASAETGLPGPRLAAERDRTSGQLRLFASILRDPAGDPFDAHGWQEVVLRPGDPERAPRPRPDLRRMLRPLGPVGVFGASNFPLAYSVAGGDTASALAAGCPVIVKGHAAHPEVALLVGRAVAQAVRDAGVHPGFFSLLLAGGDRDVEVGRELVAHPRLRAVGFTGSVPGGTAIMRLAAERQEPIPVYAEMGSVNPVFVTPGAAARDADGIAALLADSATTSVGQMCTCPGIICLVGDDSGGRLRAALEARVRVTAPQVMLSQRTHGNYRRRLEAIGGAPGVGVASRADGASATRSARHGEAHLFTVELDDFLAAPGLFEECFGPAAILVRCGAVGDFRSIIERMPGSLTGSLFVDERDDAERDAAIEILDALADRVGRVIVNGVPTGVEVSAAMVHSGPFPACSRPDSTAVGPFAMRRWLRPVCWQACPEALLPPELRAEAAGPPARRNPQASDASLSPRS